MPRPTEHTHNSRKQDRATLLRILRRFETYPDPLPADKEIIRYLKGAVMAILRDDEKAA